MREGLTFEFDRQRLFTDVGTLILSRFLMLRPRSLQLENVELDREFQRRGVDLIWRRAIPGHEQTLVEIKCDTHAGTDETLARSAEYPYYGLATSNFALETVANDVVGKPGWVFGSGADMLLYYFAAIPRTIGEIEELWTAGEEYLLANLNLSGDLLYVIDLPMLREWFVGVQQAYREIAAQNTSYRTRSRLVPCRDVLDAIEHCRLVEDVYRLVISAPGFPKF
ncbi:MAG TPA: hypothetical protein VJG32_07025 [Anaerolineae bacterium]|nr:hypothetical protein [Anaerolineae bacterium]